MFGRTEPYMVPRSVFSWSAIMYGVIGARTFMAAMPTMTAVQSDGVEDLQRGRLAADRVEGVIGAPPAGQRTHVLDHVLGLGVDRVGGAELARVLELVVEQVAGDDQPGAGQPGALDDVEPHATAADHDDRGAGLDFGAAGDGADTRRHAAAHERRLRPRHLLPDRHQHLRRTHDGLRERPDARHLEDVLAVTLEAAGAVEHHPPRRLVPVADNRPADRAIEAP